MSILILNGQLCMYTMPSNFTPYSFTQRGIQRDMCTIFFYSKELETTFGNQTRQLIWKFNLMRNEGTIRILSKTKHKQPFDQRVTSSCNPVTRMSNGELTLVWKLYLSGPCLFAFQKLCLRSIMGWIASPKIHKLKP